METITVTKTERWGRTYSTEVYFDGCVYRWKSNGQIPPADAIVDYGIDNLPNFNAETHTATRKSEDAAFFARYREAQRKAGPPSEERLAEMRAAFGTGVTVVDVISGRRTRL